LGERILVSGATVITVFDQNFVSAMSGEEILHNNFEILGILGARVAL
jgi:hypothetical protein